MSSAEIGSYLELAAPYFDFFGTFADAVGDGFSALSFFVGSLDAAAVLLG